MPDAFTINGPMTIEAEPLKGSYIVSGEITCITIPLDKLPDHHLVNLARQLGIDLDQFCALSTLRDAVRASLMSQGESSNSGCRD